MTSAGWAGGRGGTGAGPAAPVPRLCVHMPHGTEGVIEYVPLPRVMTAPGAAVGPT